MYVTAATYRYFSAKNNLSRVDCERTFSIETHSYESKLKQNFGQISSLWAHYSSHTRGNCPKSPKRTKYVTEILSLLRYPSSTWLRVEMSVGSDTSRSARTPTTITLQHLPVHVPWNVTVIDAWLNWTWSLTLLCVYCYHTVQRVRPFLHIQQIHIHIKWLSHFLFLFTAAIIVKSSQIETKISKIFDFYRYLNHETAVFIKS